LALLTIEIKDAGVTRSLEALRRRMGNLRPVLKVIGEELVESTKRRFETGKAPDGTPWAANKPSTVKAYLKERGGSFKDEKLGILTKRGDKLAAGKRPLIGATRQLSSQINYRLDGQALLVGSSRIYARTQQFGAKRREYQGVAPWGDVPARPFLGISPADREMIAQEVSDYISGDF
jgi:phage virion morphogenesis protein